MHRAQHRAGRLDKSRRAELCVERHAGLHSGLHDALHDGLRRRLHDGQHRLHRLRRHRAALDKHRQHVLHHQQGRRRRALSVLACNGALLSWAAAGDADAGVPATAAGPACGTCAVAAARRRLYTA